MWKDDAEITHLLDHALNSLTILMQRNQGTVEVETVLNALLIAYQKQVPVQQVQVKEMDNEHITVETLSGVVKNSHEPE